MADYPNFSDFVEEPKALDGDKKKIEDILNQNILVVAFKIRDSKQKQDSLYATIQFKVGEDTHIVFTGSGVLIDQLKKYKDKIPFYATIKKINKYYVFT